VTAGHAFREAAAASDRMFWLDGGGARPWSGNRSVLGVLSDEDVSLTFDAASRTVLRHCSGSSEQVGDDIFEVLEEQVALDRGDPSVSWVGYLGYACRPDLPARPSAAAARDAVPVPDAVWMRTLPPSRHSRRAEPSLAPGRAVPRAGSSGISDGSTQHEGRLDEGYAEAFAEVQRQLRLGNSYEVNLTYREQVESPLDPVTAYLRLRELNHAPYSGYLQHHGVHLLSSSPERFATIDRHRTLEARPIKGTTPRGATEEEDERHRRHLAADPKYRAENLMIVDLLRNDLSMVCEPGSVTVPALMEVESYQSVHQLVSTVRGRLRNDVTTIGALRALFPAGSMTGAPKRRTMEIIDAVEATPRGVYAGAFGWLSGDGRADLSVVIRTLVTGMSDGSAEGFVYELGTGGGITVRSELEEEWAETRWKAARLRAALGAGPLP
jgi:para-aminobenzoate synthetase